jgi:hypothetical protein
VSGRDAEGGVMDHTDSEMLKFGRMVFGMITDVLAVRTAGSHAYGNKRVTMRGNHGVHVFVIAGDDLAEKLHQMIASIDDVASIQVNERTM